MIGKNSLTLIVPCYNEEKNIQKGVLERIGGYTAGDKRFLEVLIVDDGSSDSSKSIIKKKYLQKFKKFRLIENPHQGKAASIMTGISQAKGSYVMFTDIDLATPLEEAEKLIEEANRGNQVVIGSRSSRRAGASLLRKIMAQGAIVVRSVVIGIPGIHDTQCGFKLFEKKTALTIISKLKVFRKMNVIEGSSVSAAFDMEFIFLASRLGYKIKEVPVIWRHVETKNVNFLKDSLETLGDIAKIKYYDLTRKYAF